MYLVSVYFDKQTDKRMQSLIQEIAEKTGNSYMTDNRVPPHMTISSVEARKPERLLPVVKELAKTIQCGTIQLVSVGMFFPYVVFLTPVLNQYLQEVSEMIYTGIHTLDEVKVGKYYRPMQWFPHITLGKTLSEEQMRTAFAVVQQRFVPFEGKVTAVGLAKTNPHEDLWRITL